VTEPDSLPPSLSIRLFGPFEARVGDAPLPRLRSRKGQSLLSLLVLRHGCEIERAWLAGLLWPDAPASQGWETLRRNLTDLRQALGPTAGALRSPTRRTLVLDLPESAADVVAFDAAITRGDTRSLASAIALYRGPLLEGCQEEWVFEERERRCRAYLGALEQLSQEAIAGGDLETAVGYLRRAAAADPLRESVQRGLMAALAAGGNYGAALLIYRDLRLLLHRELNAEPDPETSALFESIRAEAREKAALGSRPAGMLAPSPPHPRTSGGRVPTSGGSGWRDSCSVDRTAQRGSEATYVIPRPLTSLVGREDEVRAILRCLTTSRLVTLVGIGGIGKTRLAIQVAQERADLGDDAVCFVTLAALADPALVPHHVARAMGLRETPDHPPTEALQVFLRAQQMLLVLDNCEHLAGACAHLVESLLSEAPGLRVLATSRQTLGMTGETVWRVPPLSLPEERSAKPDELLGSEAACLFMERATAVLPTFRMTAQAAAVIPQICRRLDGIPLAIELAAARVKVLSVEQIAARLDDRFRLLTGGSRTALPRHQTLQATMDWSYELLDAAERALLRRLSVFAGGWTLAAAEAVCGDAVLDPLTRLVDTSLVEFEPLAHEPRYRLLETVRQYGWERLVESGEAETVRGQHLHFFVALAERVEPALHGAEALQGYQYLDRERGNLQAALEWSRAHPSRLLEGLRLAGALKPFWLHRGYWSEGWAQLSELLALEQAQRGGGGRPELAARAKALLAASWLRGTATPAGTGVELASEARAAYEALGDRQGVANAIWSLGAFNYQRAPEEARAFLGESLAIFRELGDGYGTALSLMHIGATYRVQNDLTAARGWLEEALQTARNAASPTAICTCLNQRGMLAEAQEDLALARACFEEALAINRELEGRSGEVWSLSNLGRVVSAQGDHTDARAFLAEGLTLAREIGGRWEIVRLFGIMATDALAQGQTVRAVRLLGAAEKLQEAIGSPMPIRERADCDRSVALARAHLTEEQFAAAWAAGQAMTPEQAIDAALAEESATRG
jgi:non-specific serine/threonine protein kinase